MQQLRIVQYQCHEIFVIPFHFVKQNIFGFVINKQKMTSRNFLLHEDRYSFTILTYCSEDIPTCKKLLGVIHFH